MLVSREYSFLFIHVNKVAGNSIVEALRKPTTGPFERINIRTDEILRAVGTRIQRRAGLDVRLHNPFCRNPYKFCAKHTHAREALALLGDEEFDRLFKFAFVRNPWDRVVSRYFYARGHASHALYDVANRMNSFEEYVEWAVKNTKPFIQLRQVSDEHGNILLDYIGKFETLEQDFSRICEHIGIPDSGLRKMNPSAQRKESGYREYYNDRTRDLVAEFCRPDIEAFGYDF